MGEEMSVKIFGEKICLAYGGVMTTDGFLELDLIPSFTEICFCSKSALSRHCYIARTKIIFMMIYPCQIFSTFVDVNL